MYVGKRVTYIISITCTSYIIRMQHTTVVVFCLGKCPSPRCQKCKPGYRRVSVKDSNGCRKCKCRSKCEVKHIYVVSSIIQNYEFTYVIY